MNFHLKEDSVIKEVENLIFNTLINKAFRVIYEDCRDKPVIIIIVGRRFAHTQVVYEFIFRTSDYK